MASWDGITTYEDLQAMTPAERHENFVESIVLDPATLPPAEQARVEAMRERAAARILAREAAARRAS